MSPEFSRPIDAEAISGTPRRIEIDADEAERRKLAGRFSLKALDRLAAAITLSRRAGIIHADGLVEADVMQSCVVTAEPLSAAVRAPFSVRYVPDDLAISGEEEVELSAEDCDTLPVENSRIDLGELVAETLALALDPYPRAPGADAALQESGHGADEVPGPFAALQELKDRLGKAD